MAPTGSVNYIGQLGGGRFSGYESPVSLTASADGQLQSVSGFYGIGSATNADNGSAGGVVGWARWVSGTTTDLGQGGFTLGAGGMNHIWGTPATAVPTTGTATYTLAGGTRPTTGSGPAGTLDSAAFAVDFAARKVGFQASITVGGGNASFSTVGGAAAPSLSLRPNSATFAAGSNQLTLFGAGAAAVEGFLAGPGASHAGLGYILQTDAGNIGGTIAFAKVP